jgi:hypothetical protein
MAPEQASGQVRDVGPATDVYALGAILYYLLTGKPPFEADAVIRTIELVRTEPPARPRSLRPEIPADLETICLKCLEKDPEDRYASARALADDLGRFLAGEAILAREVTFFGRLTRLINRTPDVVRLRRIHTRLMLATTPLPFVGQLVFYLFAGGESWYGPAAIWLMLALALMMFCTVALAHRAGLTMTSSAVNRQLWSLRLAELLAVALVPLVLVSVWPPGIPWDPLTAFPFWSITAGLAIFTFGSILWGRMYLLGLSWFVVAAVMPQLLHCAPVIFAGMVTLTFGTIVIYVRSRADAEP